MASRLLLVVTLTIQLMCTFGQQCDIDFQAVLQKANLISCASDKDLNQDCSLLHHLNRLADAKNVELRSLTERVAVAVVLSSQLATNIKAAWNKNREAQTARHLAFVAEINCSAADVCEQIRNNCPSSDANDILLLSAYCSESVACAPIGARMDQDGQLSMPPDLLSYVSFRLLERQLFIAKELNEVWLSVSSKSEYLIQNEMQSAHGNRFSEDRIPVAMFVAWPLRTNAYYHQFSLFLDAALSLKKLFSFHIVEVQISRIKEYSARPFYRYEFENHQAYLGLYTKSHCNSKPNWAFDCKPLVANADLLLTSQQFSSFLLHNALNGLSIKPDDAAVCPFPAFSRHNEWIDAFSILSDSYVIEVAPDESMLTDPFHDWERLKDMSVNLGGLFGLKFYPVIVTKSLALDLTAKLDTKLHLSKGICEKSCFLIRMPGAGFELLDMSDSLMKLETAVQQAFTQQNEWQHTATISLHNIQNFNQAELPSELTNCGHIAAGSCKAGSVSSVGRSAPHGTLIKDVGVIEGRVDAFVEQSKFTDVIYNTTDVLVVEQNQELFDSFLLKLGVEKPWLVLFSVSWSPVCKAARAIWSAVAQCIKRSGSQDVQLVKLDCFEANAICNYLEVNTYPTIALFKRGRKLSTYTGPISVGRLCGFVSLALAPQPMLHSQSVKQTSKLLGQFLPLMSRAFVISGSDISPSIARLASEIYPNEVFIFEELNKIEQSETYLRAFYHESYPDSKQFSGNIGNFESLKQFVIRGHLDVIFPCNWEYLVEAVNSTRPLVVLFHTTTMSDHLELLRHLGEKFIEKGASICHLVLHENLELDDLVQQVAGHSLPALVLLAGDRTMLHQLPLGPISPDALVMEASDWVARGLHGGLTVDGRPVERLKPWEPAFVAYNFVEQIYKGNRSASRTRQGRGASGSRFFSPTSHNDTDSDAGEPAGSRTSSDEAASANQFVHEEL